MNLMSGGSGSTKIAKRWARVAGSGLGQKAQGHTMTTWQQDMAGQLSKPRCKKVQQKKVKKRVQPVRLCNLTWCMVPRTLKLPDELDDWGELAQQTPAQGAISRVWELRVDLRCCDSGGDGGNNHSNTPAPYALRHHE